MFGEEDVVNMFPVVKHLKTTGTDASRLVQQAQVVIQQGERHKHTNTQTLWLHSGLAWVNKDTDPQLPCWCFNKQDAVFLQATQALRGVVKQKIFLQKHDVNILC